jgi:hypothetical protein
MFKETMEAASKQEHKVGGLGLLLHHHFSERVLQIKWGLYLHTLRFARFCTNTTVIKANHTRYRIALEYVVCLTPLPR